MLSLLGRGVVFELLGKGRISLGEFVKPRLSDYELMIFGSHEMKLGVALLRKRRANARSNTRTIEGIFKPLSIIDWMITIVILGITDTFQHLDFVFGQVVKHVISPP
jgi:hypothetical protein